MNLSISAPPDNEAIRESRDTLNDLTKEIKKSNKASSRLNKSIWWLTLIMAIIAIIEFFTKILPWMIDYFS
ncbi:hypothetical protein COY05_05110 [Candidatus Peregrinibacteria bacterium CG_4_10_14_0_2_um_filter_38_24]|nr:MAG: hypothetical protein COY05_05110 [Candidatus Peregrinibacteria bacterium CG_4_10_14_0_2_um_filter_38_24]PJC39344.1 MAG: hypothetical protein CO044_00270 [Candidatus Peregrinibacteria bacterium CG_4_9_14_0_2_um_filter_38_9]